MTRQFLLFAIVAMFLLSCASSVSNTFILNGTEAAYNESQAPFYHGVASGDPLQDKVIIWTRITPKAHGITNVKWEVSQNSSFNPVLQSGMLSTDSSKDYTIKMDVGNLDPDQIYFYRFNHEGRNSPIGRTKTLPAVNADEVAIAIVSCSNYEFGYFNAYNGIAESELDAVLHLGDYIYEYAPGGYGDETFPRKHLPAKEIVTLTDYRTRYAQYRLDKGLQNAHGSHPFIVIWDDHEVANNSHQTGAQNHQEDEGDYEERKRVARQAYYEWQPIRESESNTLYRKFTFGDMADIMMMDERLEGRNEPPENKEEAAMERSMLGAQQLKWLQKELTGSRAKWRIIGNQVIFSPCDLSTVRPESPINLDAWDGYATERDKIRQILARGPVQNTIIVTGDTHSSWAFEVPDPNEDYSSTGASCAVEIATPSISSSNANERQPDDLVKLGEGALMQSNPHLKYVNLRDHGYVVVTLNDKFAKAEWFYTSDLKKENAEIKLGKSITINRNNQKFGF